MASKKRPSATEVSKMPNYALFLSHNSGIPEYTMTVLKQEASLSIHIADAII